MSFKSENWKDKLAQVRAYGTFAEHKEDSIEESADDILNREIEEELKGFDETLEVAEETVDEEIVLGEEGMGDKLKKLFLSLIHI